MYVLIFRSYEWLHNLITIPNPNALYAWCVMFVHLHVSYPIMPYTCTHVNNARVVFTLKTTHVYSRGVGLHLIKSTGAISLRIDNLIYMANVGLLQDQLRSYMYHDV